MLYFLVSRIVLELFCLRLVGLTLFAMVHLYNAMYPKDKNCLSLKEKIVSKL